MTRQVFDSIDDTVREIFQSNSFVIGENDGPLDRVAADRLVRGANVRAVLALVARGEVAAGIVYASDVAVSDRVRMVGRFPAASHDAIIYPAVRLTGGGESAAAAAFYTYLVSSEGRALLAGHGFDAAGLAPCPG